MLYENRALWLPRRGAKFEVGPAPYTPPGADEVVVRVHAIAVNPVDGIPGYAYRLIVPWVKLPPLSAATSPGRSSRSDQTSRACTEATESSATQSGWSARGIGQRRAPFKNTPC